MPTTLSDQALAHAAIRATGLPVTEAAAIVGERTTRGGRTVFRWLAGESRIPAAARAKLEAMLADADE